MSKKREQELLMAMVAHIKGGKINDANAMMLVDKEHKLPKYCDEVCLFLSI